MKKLSLRLRLTLLNSLLLMACCAVVTVCVMNSALMKLDSIETGMLSVCLDESSEYVLQLNLADVFPEVSEAITAAKSEFLLQSIVIALCICVSGALLTWFVSRLALRPIRELSSRIDATTEKNLEEPLPMPETRDEVSRLTEAFNRMRSRLNEAFLSQKQFSANAAHELRTPLAVMQTSLEVFQRKPEKSREDYSTLMEQTLGQVERLNRLVGTLLEFQSMHTAELTDTVSLPELAEEILCDLDGPAGDRQVKLHLTLQQPEDALRLTGNEVLVYRALYNLVENAVKYNRPGGRVELRLQREGDLLCAEVADTGTGIPRDRWEDIFAPFYRVDKSRSRKSGGAGLGLAMVREIAVLHGGGVFVQESSENGSVICLQLGRACRQP